MKYWLFTILGFFIPAVSLAANPLDFTPPPDDLSIVFLGNIFGVVDGVLSGAGSQILGEMFGIFNAAVLAIGGIILLYVTIVSTLNTANEGEFLGKKWSSIWIPVRAIIGVALLIPKQSGYCLMQIFVMWIVVQGVGAADRVWSAALDYMDAGGVIVTETPFAQLLDEKSPTVAASGNLLLAQTCMNTLYKFLETTRKKNIENGLCPSNINSNSKVNVGWWCKPIPNFSNDVASELMKNQLSKTTGNKTVAMPNVDKATYPEIHGICGKIGIAEASGDYATQLEQMRGVAATQVFLNLGSTALKIIRNQFDRDKPLDLGKADYILYKSGELAGTNRGVSIFTNRDSTKKRVRTWTASNGSALLNGKEIIDSALAYNKILEPVLRTIALASKSDKDYSKEFIKQAKIEGWILAGAYFYDLAKINKKYNAEKVSEDKGLVVNFKMEDVTDNPQLKKLTENQGQNRPAALTSVQLAQIKAILNGGEWKETIDNQTVVKKIEGSNTVSGHLEQVEKMAGMSNPYGGKGPSFSTDLHIDSPPPLNIPELPNVTVKFGFWNIAGSLTTGLYNYLLKPLMRVFTSIAMFAVMPIVDAMMGTPLMVFSGIFEHALKASLAANANPISLLAGLGASMMSLSVTMWLTGLVIATKMASVAGAAAGGIVVLTLGMLPVFFSLLATVFLAGTMLAFYLPLIPFIVFMFGALAWMIGVIESMVAAPIVALGVMHPEGHEAFGKADNAVMLILNVFLRPSMMIIGFIAGIILSYVGLWMLNVAFDRVIMGAIDLTYESAAPIENISHQFVPQIAKVMMMVVYVTLVMTIIHKAFSLIHYVPDKVLRWLSGGLQEQLGSSMTESSVQEAQGMARQLAGTASQAVSRDSSKGVQQGQQDWKGGGKKKSDQVGGSKDTGDNKEDGGGGDDGDGSANIQPQVHVGDDT
jgi:defect-in-organelle-trafficking protein DotA